MKIVEKIKRYPKIGLVILAYVAFIALGMPDGLLGVAWPSIRAGFNVPLDALGLLLPVSTAGYLTSSFLSGPLISRWGVGKVLTVSCFLTGMALIGYTLVPLWWMMVALGVLAGLGAGAIDAGLNSYVAAHFGEGLMQWLHASYGVGVTLGPVIMTISLATWSSWRVGYRMVGGFQWFMAVCFLLTIAMWSNSRAEKSDEPRRLTDYKTPMWETMKQPRAWLSAFLFFTYVGAEVSLGTWTYSLLVESRGISPEVAGLFAGSYWAAFTIGRVIAGLFARRVGVHLMVQGSLVLAVLGSILLLWNPADWTNLAAVGLIGLAIAPIFPALMSGTSERVGIHQAANTIGMQMAASGLGTAIIPGLLGVLADQITLEVVPFCILGIFLVLFLVYRLSLGKKQIQKETAI